MAGNFYAKRKHPNEGLTDPRWQRGAAVILGLRMSPTHEKLEAMTSVPVPEVVGQLSVAEIVGFRAYQHTGGAEAALA